ncbi:MAG: hypothetical protein WA609_01115 [Terriglobales bacterium]
MKKMIKKDTGKVEPMMLEDGKPWASVERCHPCDRHHTDAELRKPPHPGNIVVDAPVPMLAEERYARTMESAHLFFPSLLKTVT